MSHIDVHEIKLNLRYPNSRQEDITDAFMRGYQEALKIGYDSRKVNETSTYMGMPIECIVIMYDYLKNHDGAIDGGFSEGFLAGARYAAETMQEDMRKSIERNISNIMHEV